jgi:hypothetical protein
MAKNGVIQKKICAHCNRKKSLDQYYTDNKAKDKLSSWCKTCTAIGHYARKHPATQLPKTSGRTVRLVLVPVSDEVSRIFRFW